MNDANNHDYWLSGFMLLAILVGSIMIIVIFSFIK